MEPASTWCDPTACSLSPGGSRVVTESASCLTWIATRPGQRGLAEVRGAVRRRMVMRRARLGPHPVKGRTPLGRRPVSLQRRAGATTADLVALFARTTLAVMLAA